MGLQTIGLSATIHADRGAPCHKSGYNQRTLKDKVKAWALNGKI